MRIARAAVTSRHRKFPKRVAEFGRSASLVPAALAVQRSLFAAAVLKAAELREALSWVRGIGGIDLALDVLGESLLLGLRRRPEHLSLSGSLPASPVTDEKFSWDF